MQILLVKSLAEGIEKAKQELSTHLDSRSVLFLSGGKTPKSLYTVLAEEGNIRPAAVGMIDERYGLPMHEQSNEKMIAETGLLRYLHLRNIPFNSMIQEGLTREEAAVKYDEKVREFFFNFPKSIGILGIGTDGHTAGIPPSKKQKIQGVMEENIYKNSDFVTSYDIKDLYADGFGPRVTMTFAGLALLDHIIVFVFGKEKAKALKLMFTGGSLQEIPARFFVSPEIAKKTIIITDQKV